MKNILLTGGCGYIGSHTAVELINNGYEVVIVDNLSNSDASVCDRIETISGKKPRLYIGDVCDKDFLEDVFKKEEVEAVIHFAGFKAVGESVEKPLEYYRNNLDSTLNLVETMKKYDCKKLVFSSSATVYGSHNTCPMNEEMSVGGCTNPYGWTKHMNEIILKDYAKADKDFSVVLLRYFNPVGAHKSGLIGEAPNGIPNNLMPYIQQVAAGIREHLNVFGNDYDTPDGTGVRDYIHVVDLAKGHVKAIEYAEKNVGTEVFNLGTGTGYSVLDMLKAFEKANGVNVPYIIAARREGDIASCYADPSKAKKLLNWQAEYGLEDMCHDAWTWEKNRK